MKGVVILGGSRTPFVKAGGVFKNLSALDLGLANVAATISKLDLDPHILGELVYGNVLLNPRTPNLAREIVLRSSKLPDSLSAHFVSNNCITGLVAADFLAESISSGRVQAGLAGGVESMSCPTLTLSEQAEKFYLNLFQARSMGEKLAALAKFRPGFLMPQAPSPKEPSTGKTMGQHCEISAQEFGISREVQDQIAFQSHQNAFNAQQDQVFTEEIVELNGVSADNIIRGNTSLEKLASLRTVFDKSPAGTLTAGNSSALTDGASSVCLAHEDAEICKQLEPLAYIADIQFAGINPEDGLLMGPAFALNNLLQRNNLKIDDIDRFEIHEAFAAQVACNVQAWEKGWDKYPELLPLGELPQERINVHGGSLAIGHPFAATGGRLLLSLANELKRKNLKTGVISICAAGAMAGAVLLKR